MTLPGRYLCLTIKQPWAEDIIAGRKSAENRSWPTRHRGLLLIHAGRAHRIPDLPIGVLLGAVDLVHIHPPDQPSGLPGGEPGQQHWELRRPRRFPEPIECRGRQGIWALPDPLRPLVERLLQHLQE